MESTDSARRAGLSATADDCCVCFDFMRHLLSDKTCSYSCCSGVRCMTECRLDDHQNRSLHRTIRHARRRCCCCCVCPSVGEMSAPMSPWHVMSPRDHAAGCANDADRCPTRHAPVARRAYRCQHLQPAHQLCRCPGNRHQYSCAGACHWSAPSVPRDLYDARCLRRRRRHSGHLLIGDLRWHVGAFN